MKKKLNIFIALLLIPIISVVKAEEVEVALTDYSDMNEEWANISETHNKLIDIVETDDNFIVMGNIFIINYSKRENISTEYKNEQCANAQSIIYYKEANKFTCTKRESSDSKTLLLMDDKLQIEREIQYDEAYKIYRPTYINKIDGYYVFIYISDKKTTLVSDDFKTIKTYEKEELTEEQYAEFWGKYNIIRKSKKSEEAYQSATLEECEKYYLLQYSDNVLDETGYIIYDKNFNKIIEKTFDSKDSYQKLKINNNGLYGIEIDKSNLTNGDIPTCTDNPKCYGTAYLVKYNFSGEKEYSREIKTALQDDSMSYGEIMYLEDFFLDENNLKTFFTFSIPAESQWSILSYIKYNFVYNINVETDGNGTVDINYHSAHPKTGIEYEIIPKEGYDLSGLSVQTVSGNEVEVTNGKFLMPAEDVIINANFITEEKNDNPNTSDSYTILIIMCMIALFTINILLRKKDKAL